MVLSRNFIDSVFADTSLGAGLSSESNLLGSTQPPPETERSVSSGQRSITLAGILEPGETPGRMTRALASGRARNFGEALGLLTPSQRSALSESLGSTTITRLLQLSRLNDHQAFQEGLMSLAGTMVSRGNLDFGVIAYQVLGAQWEGSSPQASSGSTILGRAQRELNAIRGVGGFTWERARHLAGTGIRAATDFATLTSMLGAGATYKAFRLGLMGRMAAIGLRGPGVRLAANLGAYSVESVSFVGYGRLGASLFHGQPLNFTDNLGHDIAGSFIMLGALKLMGAGATGAFNRMHAGTFFRSMESMAGSRAFFGAGGMYAGLMTADVLEQRIGLKDRTSLGQSAMEAGAMLLHFQIAGALIHRFTPAGFQAAERQMERYSELLARRTDRRGTTGPRELVPAWVGIGDGGHREESNHLEPSRDGAHRVFSMGSGRGGSRDGDYSFYSLQALDSLMERIRDQETLANLILAPLRLEMQFADGETGVSPATLQQTAFRLARAHDIVERVEEDLRNIRQRNPAAPRQIELGFERLPIRVSFQGTRGGQPYYFEDFLLSEGISLTEDRLWDARVSMDGNFGESEDARNLVLAYQAAIDEGFVSGVTLEIIGNVSPEFQTAISEMSAHNVEILYTLPLTNGSRVSIPLKARLPAPRFNRDSNYDPIPTSLAGFYPDRESEGPDRFMARGMSFSLSEGNYRLFSNRLLGEEDIARARELQSINPSQAEVLRAALRDGTVDPSLIPQVPQMSFRPRETSRMIYDRLLLMKRQQAFMEIGRPSFASFFRQVLADDLCDPTTLGEIREIIDTRTGDGQPLEFSEALLRIRNTLARVDDLWLRHGLISELASEIMNMGRFVEVESLLDDHALWGGQFNDGDPDPDGNRNEIRLRLVMELFKTGQLDGEANAVSHLAQINNQRIRYYVWDRLLTHLVREGRSDRARDLVKIFENPGSPLSTPEDQRQTIRGLLENILREEGVITSTQEEAASYESLEEILAAHPELRPYLEDYQNPAEVFSRLQALVERNLSFERLYDLFEETEKLDWEGDILSKAEMVIQRSIEAYQEQLVTHAQEMGVRQEDGWLMPQVNVDFVERGFASWEEIMPPLEVTVARAGRNRYRVQRILEEGQINDENIPLSFYLDRRQIERLELVSDAGETIQEIHWLPAPRPNGDSSGSPNGWLMALPMGLGLGLESLINPDTVFAAHRLAESSGEGILPTLLTGAGLLLGVGILGMTFRRGRKGTQFLRVDTLDDQGIPWLLRGQVSNHPFRDGQEAAHIWSVSLPSVEGGGRSRVWVQMGSRAPTPEDLRNRPSHDENMRIPIVFLDPTDAVRLGIVREGPEGLTRNMEQTRLYFEEAESNPSETETDLDSGLNTLGREIREFQENGVRMEGESGAIWIFPIEENNAQHRSRNWQVGGFLILDPTPDNPIPRIELNLIRYSTPGDLRSRAEIRTIQIPASDVMRLGVLRHNREGNLQPHPANDHVALYEESELFPNLAETGRANNFPIPENSRSNTLVDFSGEDIVLGTSEGNVPGKLVPTPSHGERPLFGGMRRFRVDSSQVVGGFRFLGLDPLDGEGNPDGEGTWARFLSREAPSRENPFTEGTLVDYIPPIEGSSGTRDGEGPEGPGGPEAVSPPRPERRDSTLQMVRESREGFASATDTLWHSHLEINGLEVTLESFQGGREGRLARVNERAPDRSVPGIERYEIVGVEEQGQEMHLTLRILNGESSGRTETLLARIPFAALSEAAESFVVGEQVDFLPRPPTGGTGAESGSSLLTGLLGLGSGLYTLLDGDLVHAAYQVGESSPEGLFPTLFTGAAALGAGLLGMVMSRRQRRDQLETQIEIWHDSGIIDEIVEEHLENSSNEYLENVISGLDKALRNYDQLKARDLDGETLSDADLDIVYDPHFVRMDLIRSRLRPEP